MVKSSDKLIIEKIFITAIEQRASDLHLIVGNRPILRLGGRLLTLDDEDIVTNEFLNNLVEFFLLPPQSKDLAREKELTIAYSWETKFRCKVSFFYQKNNLSVSVHFIPQLVRSLNELGLPEVIGSFARQRRGLVLITGPFSSGKSTTAAALLETINGQQSKHIVTIEKPIEYVFSNKKSLIEQREVPRDVNDFSSALDFVLEEDVDVVFLSELEEAETIIRALQVAESGRLVLGVMRIDSVIKAVNKLIESFGSDRRQEGLGLVAENLLVVINQKLVPRVGGGRILALELLKNTAPVKSLILDKKIYQLQSVLQTSREEGMIALDRSLAELVKAGEILIEEAMAFATDPGLVKTMLRAT